MAPSLFSNRPLANPPNRPPPQRSRLKTLSAFLFSSSAHASPSPPRHHAIPSAPMPYNPPKGEFSLPTGSPFRVFVQDGMPGDPLHQSPAGIAGLPMKGEGQEWKEMPTLASAIQLPDGTGPPTSLTFGPSQPLPKQGAEPKLPRSTSNSSSVFQTYRLGSSNSRSSVTNSESARRRMSCRLSSSTASVACSAVPPGGRSES